MDFDKTEQLREANRDVVRSFPSNIPLDMAVLYKRELDFSYEEWKITYAAEPADTAQPEAVQRVPAYLLIPLSTRFSPPFPAMIAFHQCFMDCSVGKDAVVGRIPYRPDQAYAVELALRGFVVLAPDTVCCGERLLPWIGEKDRFGNSMKRECMNKDQGNPLFERNLGYDWRTKLMLDARRAVDLLRSMAFVDAERIGAIGHSLGSETTLRAMLADERIKAGILSPAGESAAELAALAPRFVMGLQGMYEGSGKTARTQAAYREAMAYYASCGAAQNLQLRTMPCGHYFHEEFKWEAFAALRRYFGLTKREHVSVGGVLDLAMDRLAWVPKSRELVRIHSLSDVYAQADADDLSWAFLGVLISLIEKTPEGSYVDVQIRSDGNGWVVECFVPGGDDRHKQPHEYHLARVPFILADYGARLTRRTTPDGLHYKITTREDASHCAPDDSQEP